MGALGGTRPLTFITPQHVAAAAAMPTGIVVAEPCGCGGGWITYRAVRRIGVNMAAVRNGAREVITHDEAVQHSPHSTRGTICEHLSRLARSRV